MVKPTKAVKHDASKLASVISKAKKQLGYVGNDNELRGLIIKELEALAPE